MATAAYDLKPLTGNPFIDSLTNGTYWQLDSSRTLTWALANFAVYTWNNPVATAATIDSAFRTFSYYANINFQYVGLYADPALVPADIAVSYDGSDTLFSSGTTWAQAFFPNPELSQFLTPAALRGVYQTAPGDIWLNQNSGLYYTPSYSPGSQAYAIILHEMGHSLGLKHPHDNGGTGRPTFEGAGLANLDIDLATIMSYNEINQWIDVKWHPATPMILDVLALQSLYGPNLSTNAGNETHQLKNDGVFETIYDAAGMDVLDAGSSFYGWTITLGAAPAGNGALFPLGWAAPEDGFSQHTTFDWLYGDFEAVGGSRYADTITGSTNAEYFRGRGGNDVIDGGGGTDHAYFTSQRSNYTISKGTSSVSIQDKTFTDGTDTLQNIERLHFSDKSVAFDTEGNAGRMYRLYQAAFDRVPDLQGLGYWINSLDVGYTMRNVASGFYNSSEFKTLYGQNPSNFDFLTKLYNNVLHRAPDQNGFNWWLDVLNRSLAPQEQLLIDFSDSAENRAQVIGSIQNGIEYVPWA